MTYRATFDVEKSFKLRKNCPDMLDRIMDMVSNICKNPYLGTRLVNSPLYREQVGKCRILYSVNEAASEVHFIDIGWRGSVY